MLDKGGGGGQSVGAKCPMAQQLRLPDSQWLISGDNYYFQLFKTAPGAREFALSLSRPLVPLHKDANL